MKIPPDAFEVYAAMGPGRGYQGLADRYGVSKRSIVKRATKERWQERLAEIERKARERSDAKAVETLEAMKTRHLRTLQAVLGRALETLKAMPLDNAMDAVRAIDLVLKQERAIRTVDPSEALAKSVQETTREEIDRLLVENGEAA